MKKIFSLLAFLFLAVSIRAQPFADEIAAFKKQDSIAFPAPGKILFVGSSSFRLWDNFNDYFKGYPTLNRGFGGSTLLDAIRYAKDIILPYHAKQIMIYSGENDIASGDTVSAQIVLQRFKTLYVIIRHAYPKVPVAFISIKPSPSRAKMQDRVNAANALIKNYLSRQPHASFINIYPLMLDRNGQMRPELYKPDMLHMKPEGYAIWEKAITPYLVK